MIKKVLFLTKQRQAYDDSTGYSKYFASGLLNSANQANLVLQSLGYDSHIEDVPDSNYIDRETYKFKPDLVIIEAFWVTPEKFAVLQKLHPKVRWLVRNHSEYPFLANESMALEWQFAYLKQGIYIAPNEIRTFKATVELTKSFGLDPNLVVFFPNLYEPVRLGNDYFHDTTNTYNFGSFGAIRPLKNQINQAIAAILYADKHGKKLRFHMNSVRQEMGGGAVLKNLKALFSVDTNQHELVMHPWHSRLEFIEELKKMDLVMQVSYTETFNFVVADAVLCNTPVVGSTAIEWLPKNVCADPNDVFDICKKIDVAFKTSRSWFFKEHANYRNLVRLFKHNVPFWTDFLDKH